ncbi:GNAT family N-acetyltransferase [Nocardia carnea]|uniref:GNAT family N-acetyltransferase n=1 Tax=Nocardia carnea TaxID=37328 RepID=UPI002456691E|nr:GNAT family N-acetyltransferase [Nocardia carnea]
MLDIGVARAEDVGEIIALRHAAEDWLCSNGIDQWPRREIPVARFHDEVAEGEYYVARRIGYRPIVGAFRLVWTDRAVWSDDGVCAGYVHSLVIDRQHAGQGVGRVMLDWASRAAASAGATVLRLDCVENNARLCDYYLDLGFGQVGRRDLAGYAHGVVLFERRLTSPPSPASGRTVEREMPSGRSW